MCVSRRVFAFHSRCYLFCFVKFILSAALHFSIKSSPLALSLVHRIFNPFHCKECVTFSFVVFASTSQSIACRDVRKTTKKGETRAQKNEQQLTEQKEKMITKNQKNYLPQNIAAARIEMIAKNKRRKSRKRVCILIFGFNFSARFAFSFRKIPILCSKRIRMFFAS